jgi:hypothetical protein
VDAVLNAQCEFLRDEVHEVGVVILSAKWGKRFMVYGVFTYKRPILLKIKGGRV